jgi:hypothetical protein
MRKHARLTALSAALLVSAVLAAILISSASAATIQVYGRNLLTYTSSPSDPTPTSKWTAAVQGQDGLNPKGEATSLQGRAAVQETFGIKRVRIYDVTLQRLVNGVWQTVAQRTQDVVNESARAYAVAYTPTAAYCGFDSSLTRTYRVVQHHGVRRVDDLVANRTTVSKTFTARALLNDPTCPKGAWNVGIWGAPDPWTQGETRTISTTFQWVSTGGDAQNIDATVQFRDGLVVDQAPEGWERVDPTPGAALYNTFHRNFASWPSPEEREDLWTVTPSRVEASYIQASVINQQPVPSQPGQNVVNFEVVAP